MNYLPTSLIFIGYAVLTFAYVIKNRKDKIKNQLFLNEIVVVILFFIAGILYPFMLQHNSPHLTSDSLNSLWFLTSLIFLIEMGVWITTIMYNAVISKKNPSVMAERNYEDYCAKVKNRWVDDFKSEFGRKFLHLFTTFVILFFWSLGTILDDIGFLSQLKLDNYSFSHWLIVTIGLGFVMMFQIADLVRLNKFYMLPKWAKRWFLSMRPEELNTFVASTPMVLSLVPFIFAPFPILASVALITTGADAAACLIGKKYGTHKLRKDSNKTIEGFITGGVSTFLIVLLMLTIYHVWMLVSLVKIFLMAIVSTVLFLFVDFFETHISDNILNPILTGFGMWLILLL
ncbi:MAG: diacylglycerol/polyprenol kinase family protein [Candidatus Thorarchaeota archaeon]